jgi:hypothetical protein
MLKQAIVAGTAAALVATLTLACDDKQGEAEYPTGSGGTYGTTGGYGASTGAYGGTTATGGAGGGTSGNTAAALPPAAGLLVGPVLKETAKNESSGMREDGPAVVASFMQGQIFETDFTIQPTNCYAIVGVGMGVTELDIEVVLNQPPAPQQVLAADSRTGAQSVVGGAGNCYRYATPVAVPVKIRTRATGGSGIVMVQVYSKQVSAF